MKPMHKLSKSTFIRGLQCEKSLYLNKHHKELRQDISEQLEQVFSTGHRVGELAQELYPNGKYGTLPGEIPSAKSVERTMELINNGETVIYEATFIFDEVLVAMDIMVKDKNGWNALEVKSSTKVKETFEIDASVQYYVITNSGVKLNDISIIHINNQYVKQGKIDVHKLFIAETVLEEALENQEFVKSNIAKFKNVLNKKEIPNIEIGEHCFSPYSCDFMEHCWQHIPKETLFSYKGLKGNTKWDLFNKEIYKIDDIPTNYGLNSTEQLVVSSEKNNSSHINKPAIKNFVSQIEYPVYYLDFETLFMVTIPIYDGSRPFQQMPFQYSLHIQETENSKVEHKEFLAVADRNIDPRFKFIEQLVSDIGNKGSILVYNGSFEGGRLNEIKAFLPQYSAQIDNMRNRFVDLMVPFRSKDYYTPEFRGGYSIKVVLPALVPELSYKGMAIADGGEASSSFMALFDEKDEAVINKTRADLLKYCGLDTYAMVAILDVLKKV